MARWKLIEPHYINCIGKDQAEWEHKETDRNTGRQARLVYKVPRLLDPKDQADFNYREDGIIIVCWEGKGKPRDIVFDGPPTPGMEPLDEEAEAITERYRPEWHDPINEFSAISHSDRLLMNLQEQVAEMKSNGHQTVASPTTEMVSRSEFEELQAKYAELQAQLTEKSARRV